MEMTESQKAGAKFGEHIINLAYSVTNLRREIIEIESDHPGFELDTFALAAGAKIAEILETTIL